MIKRSIKRCLLIFMTITSLSFLGDGNLKHNNVYATIEIDQCIYNLSIATGEKFIQFSPQENIYKTNIYNNIGRAMIVYDCNEGFESEDIEISIDDPDECIGNVKHATYTVDKESPVIIVENLQVGVSIISIKYKATGKELCKIYIDYNKDYSNEKVGWTKDSGQWYYIDCHTRDKKIGWLFDKNNWYYLGSTGVMQTGWILDNNDEWYYLNSTGVMQTGWIQDIDGRCYYLNSDGSLRV